jgi:hypothetical protein
MGARTDAHILVQSSGWQLCTLPRGIVSDGSHFGDNRRCHCTDWVHATSITSLLFDSLAYDPFPIPTPLGVRAEHWQDASDRFTAFGQMLTLPRCYLRLRCPATAAAVVPMRVGSVGRPSDRIMTRSAASSTRERCKGPASGCLIFVLPTLQLCDAPVIAHSGVNAIDD